MKRLACLVFLLVGCTKQPTFQTIGAVCSRGHKLSEKVHAERVHVVTAVKELRGGDDLVKKAETAGRCRATHNLDLAVQDVYAIMLDAQIITTSAWGPMSAQIQTMLRTKGIEGCELITKDDPEAFKSLRAWTVEMEKAHDQIYATCREIQGPSQ